MTFDMKLQEFGYKKYNQGVVQGKENTCIEFFNEGLISAKTAAKKLMMSEEQFLQLVKENNTSSDF